MGTRSGALVSASTSSAARTTSSSPTGRVGCSSGRFSPGEPGLFEWIRGAVLGGKDPYFHLADLPSYLAVQERVSDEYRDRERWTQKAIRNVAAIGRFSSDRTVREYAQEILPEVTARPWPIPVLSDEGTYLGVISKNQFLRTLQRGHEESAQAASTELPVEDEKL